MSEPPKNPNSDQPPRIKLPKGNGNKDHPEIPDPENLPKPGDQAPPKISLPKMTSKEATSAVDLSPTGVSRPKDETIGIHLDAPGPAGSADSDLMDQTMKINLSDATQTAGHMGTSRIEISAAKPASKSFDPFDSNQTMRINLPEGVPGDSSSKTPPIPAPPAADSGRNEQAQTMRVDLEATENLTDAVAGVPTSPVTKEPSPAGQPGETVQIDPTDQTMRLNLEATGNLAASAASEKTAPVSQDTAKMVPPSETVQIDPSDQTMRVKLQATGNLGAAAPAGKEIAQEAPPGEPPRVDPSMQTMRVDLSKAEASGQPAPEISPADASMQTMRIDIPEGIPSKKKSETSRLSLGATQSLKEATSELEEQDAKSKSGTIRLGEKGELQQLAETQDTLSQQTMQIQLNEKEAGKTSPISTTPIAPPQSSSVDLGEMMGSEPAKAAKSGSPKTVRMRKPETAPQTRILKKPPAPEQTIRVQGSDTVLEGGKTGTTRIHLPDGDPADGGDKKTIRIRRPGGTPVGSVAMPISRRTSPTAGKPGTLADAPGWGYTFVAVLTAILAGITLYVLAAQLNSIPTDGQSLPWPGRIL